MARQDDTLAGVSQRPLSRQMTSVTCKYIACFLLALVDDISGRTTGSVGIATMQSKLRPATSLQYSNAFSALTLLVGCQEEHPVCKNYLSGTRCRLFAYGLADATAIPNLIISCVCPIRPPHAADAGLLLCAQRAGDIRGLLSGAQQQLRRSTARSSKRGQCHVVS